MQVQNILQYASLFTITDDLHIPTKKYVDDAISAISPGGSFDPAAVGSGLTWDSAEEKINLGGLLQQDTILSRVANTNAYFDISIQRQEATNIWSNAQLAMAINNRATWKSLYGRSRNESNQQNTVFVEVRSGSVNTDLFDNYVELSANSNTSTPNRSIRFNVNALNGINIFANPAFTQYVLPTVGNKKVLAVNDEGNISFEEIGVFDYSNIAGTGIVWTSSRFNLDLAANSGLEFTSTDAAGQLRLKGLANYSAFTSTNLIPLGYNSAGNLVTSSQGIADAVAGSGLSYNTTTNKIDLGGLLTKNTTSISSSGSGLTGTQTFSINLVDSSIGANMEFTQDLSSTPITTILTNSNNMEARIVQSINGTDSIIRIATEDSSIGCTFIVSNTGYSFESGLPEYTLPAAGNKFGLAVDDSGKIVFESLANGGGADLSLINYSGLTYDNTTDTLALSGTLTQNIDIDAGLNEIYIYRRGSQQEGLQITNGGVYLGHSSTHHINLDSNGLYVTTEGTSGTERQVLMNNGLAMRWGNLYSYPRVLVLGNYSLSSADHGKILVVNSTSTVTITIDLSLTGPPSEQLGLDTHFMCFILRRGTGAVNINGTANILSSNGTTIAQQYDMITVVQIDTDDFLLTGNLV